MEIEFIADITNPNKYFIAQNNQNLFFAIYNKVYDSKELFTLEGLKIGQAFPVYEKKLQFIPSYKIQIFKPEFIEILLTLNSWIHETYTFKHKQSEFLVISHFGFKFSIFENNQQIAYYQKYGYNQIAGNMLLVANSTICKELFCLLCLCLYSDFGAESVTPKPAFKVVLQKRRFNKRWTPI